MRRLLFCISAGLLTSVSLSGCGGGGGSAGGAPIPAAVNSAAPTATPASSYQISGSVVQIPADAYGPIAIDGVIYQSSDSADSSPLSGAIVVAGPIPISGATPPLSLPNGDVSMIVGANGNFSGTLHSAEVSPVDEPFVSPQLDLSGTARPIQGFYVSVFGQNSDGLTAGLPMPLHSFASTSKLPWIFRVSTPSEDEASALNVINADRLRFGTSGKLIFDETSEEMSRLHASDEAAHAYSCHYDTHNVGPTSRFLAGSGLGLDTENISAILTNSVSNAFELAEAGYIAESGQSGLHFENVIDTTHLWAGVSAVPSGSLVQVDYELVTPSGQDSSFSPSGYPVAGSCPSGTFENGS